MIHSRVPSMEQDTATHVVSEPRAVPVLSLVLGYGAAVPFWLGAAAAWLADGEVAAAAVYAVILWGGLILAFLSGVRRGLSFRTEGGPRPGQIVVSMALFGAALAAFLLPWTWAALAVMIVAYGSLAAIDPRAARRGEAPLFFVRLRPVQMPLIVVALAVCLARVASL